MGDRPSAWRKRSSSRERDTAAPAARSATVQRALWFVVEQRERRGQHRIVEGRQPSLVGRRGVGQVGADHLDEHQLGQARGQRVGAGVGGPALVDGVGDARLHPADGRSVGQPHDEHRREGAQRGIEERVGRVEVAAHEIGRGPLRRRGARRAARARAGGRATIPIGHALGRLAAADQVAVAVRDDDHIALGGPVAGAVVGPGDPARAPGDDVEQDDPDRAPGCSTPATSLGDDSKANALGQLGAEEDGALEAHLLERRTQDIAGRGVVVGHRCRPGSSPQLRCCG